MNVTKYIPNCNDYVFLIKDFLFINILKRLFIEVYIFSVKH